ncbi:hypothetical protein B0T21DRAFT_390903 [Apiosordaria backusii]|uniref:Uncharacterized protein n=1 Tax=Apiosordaria backusii TaxID=314023 RepID=A0AA40K148_9PEZI|nr:hypothetical protein B0T21DRAFT_390903 [Apiosordaria backusii]
MAWLSPTAITSAIPPRACNPQGRWARAVPIPLPLEHENVSQFDMMGLPAGGSHGAANMSQLQHPGLLSAACTPGRADDMWSKERVSISTLPYQMCQHPRAYILQKATAARPLSRPLSQPLLTGPVGRPVGEPVGEPVAFGQGTEQVLSEVWVPGFGFLRPSTTIARLVRGGQMSQSVSQLGPPSTAYNRYCKCRPASLARACANPAILTRGLLGLVVTLIPLGGWLATMSHDRTNTNMSSEVGGNRQTGYSTFLSTQVGSHGQHGSASPWRWVGGCRAGAGRHNDQAGGGTRHRASFD